MIKAAYHTTKFWIVIILLSMILGTLAVLARVVDPSHNLSHRVSSLWGRWLCVLNGVGVEVQGLENI
ncbi:MAG: 1-acyl-sn-glycerol-3-phosphate acyltransferase, partial [Nitrospinaceae bacterium]|nr:1-acyl-sn-glycerol-3-phosphate acyltransferase [Nitrospinaceae bacterium]NIR53618.1 1-acyl-sn-glycerol-3-phosphate acyltransferase [Nitrospinaceae bacterium]NIS84021.1 1-acyl-sn-glycerol-3-phosphate acyltransferase [Nitrospinaceae bacterium]NIT85315.1 1-acyl-sn-glycerol-3-phosphate acyltransferase [Nitrospinaceae bacterium]NIU43134.1 1-acyl-sn-glycerol-3-phosphate acyltransferase [Nitrospinaceae bacterium]